MDYSTLRFDHPILNMLNTNNYKFRHVFRKSEQEPYIILNSFYIFPADVITSLDDYGNGGIETHLITTEKLVEIADELSTKAIGYYTSVWDFNDQNLESSDKKISNGQFLYTNPLYRQQGWGSYLYMINVYSFGISK